MFLQSKFKQSGPVMWPCFCTLTLSYSSKGEVLHLKYTEEGDKKGIAYKIYRGKILTRCRLQNILSSCKYREQGSAKTKGFGHVA